MKARVICKKRIVFSLTLVVMLMSPSGAVFSDVGGGPGIPISPYKRRDIVADKETVSRLKKEASKNKEIWDLPVIGNDISGSATQFGLAFVKSDQIQSEIMYEFKGIDHNNEALIIDFSEVKSFKILGSNGSYLNVEIEHFPAITPDELLAKKPSYVDLITNYSSIVKLRMPSVTDGDAELYIVGRSRKSEKAPIVSLKDIPLGKKIRLEGSTHGMNEELWWAIPSVFSDPTYPHRVVPKL